MKQFRRIIGFILAVILCLPTCTTSISGEESTRVVHVANPIVSTQISALINTENGINTYSNNGDFDITESDGTYTLLSYNGTATDVIIPDGVNVIASEAFKNKGITSIKIPSSVIFIGNSAFADNQLSSVDIPCVQICEASAFANCKNLESVTLRAQDASSVLSEESQYFSGVFKGCPKLSHVVVDSNFDCNYFYDILGDAGSTSGGITVDFTDNAKTIQLNGLRSKYVTSINIGKNCQKIYSRNATGVYNYNENYFPALIRLFINKCGYINQRMC